MDSMTFPNLSSILALFLLAIVIIKIQKKWKPKWSNPPPGPWKLPIVGHIHHLVGSSLPHHRLRELSLIHGPVMLLRLGEIQHVVISSAEAAKEIFKTHDAVFSQRPFNLAARIITYDRSDLAHAPYGDFWRQIRKLCTLELLSPKRVHSFRPIREDEGLNFVRRIAAAADGSTAVNLSRMVFSLTYGVTSRIAFGQGCKVQDEEYIPAVEEIMAAAVGLGVADLFPSVKWVEKMSGMKAKLERLHGVQDKLLESIIAEHRGRRAEENRGGGGQQVEDLVDALLNLQRDGHHHHHLGFRLTNENIKAVIGDVFIAGSETSSTTVEWAISELIKNPTIMKKAQTEVRRVFQVKGRVDEQGLSELSYLKLVIKETLRLHTPAPLLVPRECREECEVGGYMIPAKATVMVNAWAIARDPSLWDEPEKFRPERFLDGMVDYKGTNFEYLPFGAGRRMCPGIMFGIANTELPLANLLFYFDWELPGDMKMESLDMDESFGVTVKRKHDLKVVPLLRYSLPSVSCRDPVDV